jgi:serralysin
MSDNEHHFCMCAVPKTNVKTKAALLRKYQWPIGSTITVKFLGGAKSLQERVKKVAKEWTGGANMAKVTLAFKDQGDADIRIAFQQGNGSWSYLGTYCKQIPKNEPTMNYGWLTPTSSEDELRRVVLHEFGHALGLIHEHQNPNRPIKWNKDAVYHDLQGPPNNWTKAQVDSNMFQKYEPKELKSTKTDPLSIMMYPIPKAWTLDGFSAGFNKELSATDKKFIKENYR